MSENLLKNTISLDFVLLLATDLKKQSPLYNIEFNQKQFLTGFTDSHWGTLELKQRARFIVSQLGIHLSGSYRDQIRLISPLAEKHQGGLKAMIFPDFIEVYGLDDLKTSLNALKEFTFYFSSEFAIRPFIVKYEAQMLKELLKMSKDPDEHIRRLSSEGLRPRLPWSFKLRRLITAPQLAFPVLENLKDDSSLYVRKSVANHLNDISKDHPKLILKIAKTWYGKSERTDWIIKHALRTLLKKGNPTALKLFGFQQKSLPKLQKLSTTYKTFKIGKHLEFAAQFAPPANSKDTLRIEYAIHYLKNNGSYSKKVFKISEKNYPVASFVVQRKHSLRQMTTRKHYKGLHHLEIIVNGVVLGKTSFTLS